MSCVKLVAIVFSLFAVTAFVRASESDEIREKARSVQREAAELAEQGHEEEAANLNRKAMAMLEEAERLQHDRPDQREAKIRKMKGLLEELRQEENRLRQDPDAGRHRAEVQQRARNVEMELRELSGEPRREQDRPHDGIARRLEHMRIAVEHLKQAGLHDVAEHVVQQANAAERALHERQSHQGGDGMKEIMQQLDEVRQEIGRLRGELNEIKQQQ